MYMEEIMNKEIENNKQVSLMSPKVDFVFKKIFGNPDMPDILISFLNAVLGYQNNVHKPDLSGHLNRKHPDSNPFLSGH